MLETLFTGCKQYQIIQIKEKFHSAASNSDTLIHSVVTIIPIHINYEEERCQHTIVGVQNPL